MTFLLSICTDDVGAKLFDMEEFHLDNGLKVIVIPNHKAPIIKHMVWYKTGAKDDKIGKAGTAHLLEHLMFRGTSKISGEEFNQIIQDNGGDSNAFTSYDFVAYHQTLDISRLELVMFMEADRMQNLKLSQKDFIKERDIVFNERKQNIENNPLAIFGEIIRSNLWQNHQYGRPIIGSAQEIMSLKLDDVKDFYEHYYAPNNAILVLSGDIDFETAKILADKYYGKIKRKEVARVTVFVEPEKKISSQIDLDSKDINTTRFSKIYIAPRYNFPLMILAEYLGGDDTSYLYKSLVLKQKKALAVSVDYNPYASDLGTFSIDILPVSDIEIDKEIETALKEITPEIIEKVKEKMLAGLVYLKDNPSDAGYLAGYMAVVGLSVDEIADYDKLLQKVSSDEVIKAGNDLFSNANSITGVLK